MSKLAFILIVSLILLITCLALGYLIRTYLARNNMNTIKLKSYINAEAQCASDIELIYYNQIFSNDLEDPKDQEPVNCTEAIKIVREFYSSDFKRGDHFLIGFYKEESFFELSKDDKGKVSILRIEESRGNIFSEEFTGEEAVKALQVFWTNLK